MPISPDNKFVNMDKVEMDKLEWMRSVDTSGDRNKFKSIRFHANGTVVSPDGDQPDQPPPSECDDYRDSLKHHGEEPDQNGYTISELFWLSRSSFVIQRSFAVKTLTNMLRRSHNLEHVHTFNAPTVTSSLMDCGLPFLARWLIDAAGEREQYLQEALSLLHAALHCATSEDDFDWPYHGSNVAPPLLISLKASDKHLERISLPLSERAPLHDDSLMAEDAVSCLVSQTHLLDRLSYLLVTKRLPLNPETSGCVLVELLQRVVVHSAEMAHAVCHTNAPLLTELVRRFLLAPGATQQSPSAATATVKLVRLVCHSSQSLAHKLTRDSAIIKAVYPCVTDASPGHESLQIESLRLLTVLTRRDIHPGPIAAIVPTVSERLAQLLQHGDQWASAACRSMLTFLAGNAAAVAADTQHRLLTHLPTAAIEDHPALASMLHLVLQTARNARYHSNTVSCHEVVNALWQTLLPALLPLLETVAMSLSRSCVLGYEHRNSGLQLFPLDLGNCLGNGVPLAAQTLNPHRVDTVPQLVRAHPSWALLSAMCQAVTLAFSTGLCRDIELGEGVLKLVACVGDAPMNNVVPAGTGHSLVVQLQLEAMLQLVTGAGGFWGVSLSPQLAAALYRAAVKMLPYLGPRLHPAGKALLDKVIFNPVLVATMGACQSLVEALSDVRRVYEDVCRCFKPASANMDECLPVDEFFVKTSWLDAPFMRFHHQQQQPEQNTSTGRQPAISTKSITNCLAFVTFLEEGRIASDKVVPIIGIRRIASVLLSEDWSDDATQVMVATLLGKYLSQPDQINLKTKTAPNGGPTFFNMYMTLLDQYFSVSLCDPLMANIAMFPCGMRFPVRFRKNLWSVYFDQIRLITMDLSEVVFGFRAGSARGIIGFRIGFGYYTITQTILKYKTVLHTTK